MASKLCACTTLQSNYNQIVYCPLHKAAPEMLELLKKAHEDLCSARCPSVWKTDEYPNGAPHSELCKRITAAIRAAEGKGGE